MLHVPHTGQLNRQNSMDQTGELEHGFTSRRIRISRNIVKIDKKKYSTAITISLDKKLYRQVT